MLIESITLNNYRLYEGENVIQFRFDKSKNVHLICGENGFGKTTLLHSLLWCLFGRFVGDMPVFGQEMNSSYAAMQKEILNQNAAKRFNEKATVPIVLPSALQKLLFLLFLVRRLLLLGVTMPYFKRKI